MLRYTYIACLVILMNRQKSRATVSGEWVVLLCPFRPDLAGLSCFWSPFGARGSLLLRLKCFDLYQCVRPGMLPALCTYTTFSSFMTWRTFPTFSTVGIDDERREHQLVHLKGQYLSQYSVGKINYIMFRTVYCAFNWNPMLCTSLINHTCKRLLLRFALYWPVS
jgi:hypothetical protein